MIELCYSMPMGELQPVADSLASVVFELRHVANRVKRLEASVPLAQGHPVDRVTTV